MKNYRAIYLLLLILSVGVNLIGINVRFFTDDPGLYASISKQLLYHQDFFNLYSYGKDWLDKPHFPFWAVMFSFKIFGIHSWAYKMPALICFLISLLYVWLFSKKYYGKEVAALALLILSTALHLMLSNTDVRAEPYLMAFIIGSIYHISALEVRFKIKHLLLAAMMIAFAIMTKGIFVLVVICGSLLGQLILTKSYAKFFQWKWLALIILTLIFTLPELYALYIQFDIHPEKTVFNKTHVSGLKWFLWDSQFGRFANNGPINRKSGDIFFFIHTLLWAFAPWCLLFFYSTFKSVKAIFKRRPQPEYYLLSGGLLLLLLFSLSGFQLPFYTNILFPLFSIITARLICSQLSRAEQLFAAISQWLYIVLLSLAVLIIHFFLNSGDNWILAMDLAIFAILGFLIFRQNIDRTKKMVLLSGTAMIFVNFYLNTVLYPVMVSYGGQIKAAEYINQPAFSGYQIYSVLDQNNIFQFYADRPVGLVTRPNFAGFKPSGPALFYINQETMNLFNQRHIAYKIIQTFKDYPQENIIPAFINFKTRSTALENVYLISKP